MGTHQIEQGGATPAIIETILDDLYTFRVTRNSRPVISFHPKRGAATDIQVDWLGNVGGLQLNRESIRKELKQILTLGGKVVVESRSIRHR